MPPKHIALFGASFNPPHLGHLAVIQDLAKKNLFDELWLVPVFNHPFAKDLASFDARVEMVEMMIAEIPTPLLAYGHPLPKGRGGELKNIVRICSIEKDLHKERSYMIDTITELKIRHPDCDFTLVVGSDVKGEISKWHRADELQKLVSFYFIPRQGYETSPYPQVSSSEIREKVERGESIAGLTTEKIAEYIKRKKLYS